MVPTTDLHLFDEREQPAIDAYIHAAVIPFLGEGDEVLGTGTLLTDGARYFIVTAAHVFDDAQPRSLRIGMSRTLWVRVETGFEFYRAPDADIAIIEIVDQNLCGTLARNGNRPVELRYCARFDPAHRDYLVVGFPHLFSKLGDERFQPRAAHIITTPFIGDVASPLNPLNRTTEFLLSHGTGDGSNVPTHALGGISGATVWAVRDRNTIQGVWAPQAALRIVGIQHAYAKNLYMRCHHWLVAAERLGEAFGVEL